MHFGKSALSVLARGKLSVLHFHAVPRTTTALVDELTLPPFEQIIDFISGHFNVIALADGVSRLANGSLPQRAAAITFDDGYDSWLDGVVPVLLRRSLHATFFITTGQFDHGPMWHERVAQALARHPGPDLHLPGFGMPRLALTSLEERRRALRLVEQLLKYQRREVREKLLGDLEQAAGPAPYALPCMTTDQVRALHGHGFDIGAHTVHHPILSRCERAEAVHEIGSSRETLEHIIGAPVRAFAYPNGRPGIDFNADHVDMVRAAGFTYAVTTGSGAANAHTSRFEIPRFTPWGPTGLRMGVQLARNLMIRPRQVASGSVQAPKGSPSRRPRATTVHAPVVSFVENGAGFGGAVVALQTLLRSSTDTAYRYQVVSNLDVGDFASIPGVREHRVIADRFIDFRAKAARVRERGGPAMVVRSVLFLLGRLDDLINRLPYFFRLLAHMRRTGPAIIHGNNDPSANREAMLVAKLLRIPYVQHVRGAINDSLRSAMMRDGPSVFVPVSRWLTGELLASGVPAERVRHIYDAVELSHAHAPMPSLRDELGLPHDAVLVAMVGMLVPWKGQDVFVEAVSQLRDRIGRKLVFLLIGGTPERGDVGYAAQLQAQVKRLGLEQSVLFLGQRANLPAHLPQVQICVSASTQPEPLGLVMLEALAEGCLFVGPAFGAACEVVEDGKTGFLFEPGSASSLAVKLEAALQHLAVPAHEMASPAISIVRTWFSGPRCAEDTRHVHVHAHRGA